MDENPYSIVSDYEDADWEKVYKILFAFSHKLLSQQRFRNSGRNELASDFAQEAILSYLENKSKFDPTRNPDLILYLKYNILQRLISNYTKSSKNTKVSEHSIEELSLTSHLIEEIPIDESIDVRDVVRRIQDDIRNDETMSIIFDARYEENMKRAEICELFSIDTSKFDNAMKRLRRIVEKHINHGNGKQI